MKYFLFKDGIFFTKIETNNPQYEMNYYKCNSYKQVEDYILIDVNNFFVEEVIDFYVDQTTDRYIKASLPANLIKPEWNSSQWIEGATDQEIIDYYITSMIRPERNNKLYESDYTQLSDVPLTPEKKQEWINYRQLLRDFIETIDTVEKAKNPQWPVKPEG